MCLGENRLFCSQNSLFLSFSGGEKKKCTEKKRVVNEAEYLCFMQVSVCASPIARDPH